MVFVELPSWQIPHGNDISSSLRKVCGGMLASDAPEVPDDTMTTEQIRLVRKFHAVSIYVMTMNTYLQKAIIIMPLELSIILVLQHSTQA
jgi:hypothetical protein